MAREWQVYRLTFRDGCEYVGQTIRGIHKRMLAHRNDIRTGSPVTDRLRSGDIPCVELLETLGTQAAADTYELAAIAAIPAWRRLNRPTLRVRQGTPAPPRRGCYRCTWCGMWKPVEQMSVDRNRSRGVGSKCRDCYNTYCRVSHLFTRSSSFSGLVSGGAYQVAYRLARRWREAENPPELTTARMRTWPPEVWPTINHGGPDFDQVVAYLQSLPPPPPPQPWGKPGRMSCCGAPPPGAPPETTLKYHTRHTQGYRNCPPRLCRPAIVCRRAYQRKWGLMRRGWPRALAEDKALDGAVC